MNYAIHTLRCAALAAPAFLMVCAGAPAAEAPTVDGSVSTQALKSLSRPTGELMPVSIYEFRSSVGEITRAPCVRPAAEPGRCSLARSSR